ncbi:Cytochrome b2, mitochondrial [Sphaceloma murrayae]|uniref:L-lactate dehydrogenase (cytochrome) n=1 Tax=Sphaceloma murrayae TaxID=2082308 RepID=A0A2K1QGJ5_9PEZI|nr:Cytochrome b2, mitochondrial [Sphaceloma murrayae]
MADRSITVDEISKHASSDDCWIVIDGAVWDLTEFAPDHPGGAHIITRHAGHDASTTYNSIHDASLLKTNLKPSAFKGRLDTSTITSEWAKPPPTATPQLKLNEKPPLSSILNSHDLETVAESTIAKKTWAFYSSASTDCLTRDRNTSFFSRIWLRPRVLRNVSKINTTSAILGHRVGLPLYIAPAALAKLVCPLGEKALAAGANGKTRIAQVVSTNASFPVGEIRRSEPDTPMFFQLYVNKDRAKTEALLAQVADLGIDTVFLTVDAPVPGKREADERVKADEGLSTPMSGQKAKNDAKGGGLGRIMGSYIDDSMTWDDLVWLRRVWKGKVVLKGVQGAADASMAMAAGVDGIVVSNHGGRSLDTSPPAVMVLVELQKCCPEIFGRMEVFVDSGIRRGTDLVKCLCLGATAVGMGRSFLYSLMYGKEGVEQLIEIMRDEVETTMKMLGVTRIEELHPGLVSTLDVDHLVNTTEGHPYATGLPKGRVMPKL